ncbi:MAG: hypothetical protein HRT86_16810 [Ilumatobacteraceae bacterium]|nr:hypothetical protein [Ilumatobacteraceae bacterium]
MFDRAAESGSRFELTSSDLALLLDGIDLRGASRRKARDQVMQRLA